MTDANGGCQCRVTYDVVAEDGQLKTRHAAVAREHPKRVHEEFDDDLLMTEDTQPHDIHNVLTTECGDTARGASNCDSRSKGRSLRAPGNTVLHGHRKGSITLTTLPYLPPLHSPPTSRIFNSPTDRPGPPPQNPDPQAVSNFLIKPALHVKGPPLGDDGLNKERKGCDIMNPGDEFRELLPGRRGACARAIIPCHYLLPSFISDFAYKRRRPGLPLLVGNLEARSVWNKGLSFSSGPVNFGVGERERELAFYNMLHNEHGKVPLNKNNERHYPSIIYANVKKMIYRLRANDGSANPNATGQCTAIKTTYEDILTGREMKVEEEQPLKNHPNTFGYPAFPNPAMFTPSQLLMASQLMAASGLTISGNPAFFHPGLLPMAWPATSPPSPPASAEPLSPAMKSRKVANHNNNNNNNNVVSSSTTVDLRKKKWKAEEEASIPLPSPTSSVSPPSVPDVKDANRQKQFTCGVCNRSFGYKHVLLNHERTHTGEKPFECPECHKRFTRDHHLKTHMRLHTGERPYHCEHCDRQFVQVANLRRHLRVHTGERPYSCEHCSAKFSDSNQLKAHVLIHTNEKPFCCDRCQCRFRRRHHLLHHKCGMPDKETTPESDEPEEELRRKRGLHPPSSPLVTLPLQVTLPEQTEPEDLSMSTGMNSNSSSGGSPARSPSSREDCDEEDYDPHESAAAFLQRRPLGRS
ncbi:hypothetical protein NQ318_017466 [Aromia moschata]|uniref:C2H2-type domain-containing protein n=1 Tax=Aromia moschata TaxID=1265417 RepID=A0AAV8Z435_9CUCU|nr:hypothetical protein NQ318_017466 [Aromia moschata]